MTYQKYLNKKFLFLFLFISVFNFSVQSQKVSSNSSWEFLFAFSDVEIDGQNQNTSLRFSFFFNYGQQWHYDFNNYLGLYTGGYIHNFGFKLKENGVKDIYRTYSFGIPLALKLGSFDDHFYFYGGGEYEMLFHYKHKRIYDNGKDKSTGWLSSRTNQFMPSVFAGIQFPKGLNLKFTYCLDNFLNKDFVGSQFGNPEDYGSWSTQIYYFTLSFNIKSGRYKEIINKNEGELAKLN